MFGPPCQTPLVTNPSERPPAAETSEHPALAALRLAPLDDEPDTEEDRLASEAAHRDLAEGRTISHAELCAELGLDLDEA